MKPLVSKKIRNAARGELCTLNVAGVCSYDRETTIFAHLPFEGGAMGGKVTDLSGCFACHACHDAADRRHWSAELEDHREFYFRRAMVRTWERLIEMGIITVR